MNPSAGKTFVRTMKSLAVAKGAIPGAIGYAQSQNWDNARAVIDSLKAAVTGQSMSDAFVATPAAVDFADFIRPLTIIGKLTGLRRTPARTRMISATSGSTAYWAGEAQPRPISKMTLSGSTLEALSVVAMLVVTQELIQSSSPDAEPILSRDLAAAAVQAMDAAFVDSSNAGIAGVKPAAVTNGVTTIHSSGSTLANIDADLQLIIEALAAAGSDLTFATWVVRPRTAVYLSTLRGSGGALAYPQMGVRGGVLAGLPCITSAASPSDAGSPALGGEIVLLDPSQIVVVDSGDGSIEASTQASIAMADNPGSPASQVSAFQTNSTILKTVRFVNWQACRPGVAQVIDRVGY